MILRIHRIYWLFFRFLIAFNLIVTGLLVSSLFRLETLSTGIFVVMLGGKLLGWMLSIVIERWFYAKGRESLFKNAGYGYRHLLGYTFALDFIYFSVIVTLCLMTMSYM